jgi:hypothetical protein
LGLPFPGTDGWALVPFRWVLAARSAVALVCVKLPSADRCLCSRGAMAGEDALGGGLVCHSVPVPGLSPTRRRQVLGAYYELSPLHLCVCLHDCFLFSASGGRFYMVISALFLRSSIPELQLITRMMAL